MATGFGTIAGKQPARRKGVKPAATAAPTAAPAVAAAPASPYQSLNFGAYSSGAGYKRDATLAQNAYSRFLSQQRGSRDLANVDMTMRQGLEGLAAGYGRRGLTNSGIYSQGQSRYAQDWTNQRQAVLSRLYDEMRQASFGDAGAWADFNTNVTDTASQKYQQILETAAQLDQLRPFFGG